MVEHSGATWQTGAVDLSVFGMKVRPQPPSWPAEHARLSFTPPDGGPPLDLLAVLVRADSRGWAYRVNLTIGQFGQLQSLVGDLAAGSAAGYPPKPVLAEYQAGTVQIIRGSGTDAVAAGYMLMFDSPGPAFNRAGARPKAIYSKRSRRSGSAGRRVLPRCSVSATSAAPRSTSA